MTAVARDQLRDQLLASVHDLRPGDLLVVRIPAHGSAEQVDQSARTLTERRDGTGVRALVVAGDVQVEAWRQHADPGPGRGGPASACAGPLPCACTCGADARQELLGDLHRAVYGDSWARPETPKRVWEALLAEVRRLASCTEPRPLWAVLRDPLAEPAPAGEAEGTVTVR